MSPSVADNIDSYELSPDQHKAVYEQSLEFEGQAPPKEAKEDLVRTHNTNLELGKKAQNFGRRFTLPAAYSPSNASLDTLQKISLSDLKIGTHHRGCFVTARTITTSYNSTDIITILEDDSGAVAKLVQGFQLPLNDSDSGIPINSTVAIKEPYCKSNGPNDWIIRVDHPSDIAVLRGDDAAILLIMQFVAEKKQISPQQWREAGDKAYLDKKYLSAIECYTQAIDNSESDLPFKNSTLKKRAFANLTAKSFSAAKSDALSSCSNPPSTGDEKSFFCAGRAAYELSQYTESKAHFTTALHLKPNDPKTEKELKRVQTRILEQEEGIYDFKAMAEKVKNGDVWLDCADFVKRTEVRESAGRGRGFFAIEDIQKGEIIMVEKAFVFPDEYTADQESVQEKDGESSGLEMWNLNTNSRTQRSAQASLFLQLLKKVYSDAEAGKRFFSLDGGSYLRSGKEGEVIDGVPVVDAFLTEAIRLLNCFSCPPLSSDLIDPTKSYNSKSSILSTGLWTHAAMLNHSCTPNAIRSFIGDMMIIRSTRAIPVGEEIMHQYRASDAAYLVRKQVFSENWGFECTCPLCLSESKSAVEKHEERSDLLERIKKEVLKTSGNAREVSGARIKSIEKSMRKLEVLHEEEVYGAGVPRLLMIHPTIWLMERWREKKEWRMVIQCGCEVLRNFGFGVDVVKERRLELKYESGIMNVEAMRALRVMSEGYKALGEDELSKECEKEAREMFVILTGSEVGVEEQCT